MSDHSPSGFSLSLSRSLRSVMTLPPMWRRIGGILLLTPLLMACSPAEHGRRHC
jgi:hypothetical protein